VIAAGGIVDGRGIAAALALGAAAVQLGTVFLGGPEAEIDPHYRRTLFAARAAQTRITTVLSGRPARAIVTSFLDALADVEGRTAPFPIQRALTAPLSMAALSRGDIEHLAMWAGQGGPLTRAVPARELVAALAREADLDR
jgi:nitronate monooxygenase